MPECIENTCKRGGITLIKNLENCNIIWKLIHPNKMRELIYKFFDLNRQTDIDDKKHLLEYLKDEKTHELFLILLSKLRTNNRFCREKPLIELLSDILNSILDTSKKK